MLRLGPSPDLLLELNEGDPQDRLEEALTEQSGLISCAKRQPERAEEEEKERQREVIGQLSPSLQSAVDRATDDGASSWLGPLKSTALHCTKEPFAMQSHRVMDGGLLTFLRIAPVECNSTVVTR